MDANSPTPLLALEGKQVRLELLRPEHVTHLWNIARDHLDELFQWIPYRLQSCEDFHQFTRFVLDEHRRGVSVPFATIARLEEQVVGTTRFMSMDLANRKVEIGSTWI
ncbi:MAG: hypothetical protein JO356_00020, partial [Acidobacteria bacterium]|nr:hypothetical protein [Acidobacteriota bacterium]